MKQTWIILIFIFNVYLNSCKYKEYTNRDDFIKYKYLKFYINKEFNKLNSQLIKNKPIKSFNIKNLNFIEGMSYNFNDSTKIVVINNKKFYLGSDSIKKVNCYNIQLDKDVKVQSITIYNLKTNSRTNFYSAW